MAAAEVLLGFLVYVVSAFVKQPGRGKFQGSKRRHGKHMISSPINDFFIRIKNASLAHKHEVVMPHSKIKESIAKVLVREGYLEHSRKDKNNLLVQIAYIGNDPIIMGARNISTPGLHIYRKAKEIRSSKKKFITTIVSTPGGIMTGEGATKKGLGGEVIAEIW